MAGKTFSRFLLLLAMMPAQLLCEPDAGRDAEENFAVELTAETFEVAIKGNNHFVMFFAPWCGHCKRLHPLWEQLAELLNVKDEPRVVIAKVDCTQQKALCGEYEISGYPTLLFFKVGEKEGVKFKGARDMPTLTEFINQQLNDEQTNEIPTKEKTEGEPTADPHRMLELTEENFARHVSSGNHFVKFYAPWCSHCQRLAPTWEQLSETLRADNKVSISKVDCTVYRPLCQDFEVKGYPTLLWIEDGKKIEKYSGGRDLDTLKSYVDKMLGNAAEAQGAPKAEPEPDKLKALQLNGENFSSTIESGVNFVKFYAPWCGHCRNLSPTWDQLAEKFHASGKAVKIAKVDCTASESKVLCAEQQVEGYPTLFAYKSGQKLPEYDGGRSLDSLEGYVNQLMGHDEL